MSRKDRGPHRLCTLVVLGLVLAVSAVAEESQEIDSYEVPVGAEPQVNGTLEPGEWEDAASVALDARSTLYLKHADGHLFLGIRATTMGIPSPLFVRGDDVLALHASAALGTATYARLDGVWRLQQGFVWQCRRTGFSSEAVAARDRFLEQEGWVGTIVRLVARTEFEYKIRLDGTPLHMLFLFMETTAPPSVLSWPAPAEDVGDYLPLITGPVPDEIDIDYSQWATLVLAP